MIARACCYKQGQHTRVFFSAAATKQANHDVDRRRRQPSAYPPPRPGDLKKWERASGWGLPPRGREEGTSVVGRLVGSLVKLTLGSLLWETGTMLPRTWRR